MTKAMEDSKWYQGRREVMRDYINAFAGVEEAVAARGFLYRPGHMEDALTGLESGAKFNLSKINYDIVKEAIDRELAQTGHDYDMAYKAALAAWMIEKAGLLAALDQELADLRYNREVDFRWLEHLEREVNLRKLLIIEMKAQIKMDLEEIEQEMIEVKRLTWDAESALMNEKRITANKKLEVIPYIEDILEKQQELLVVQNQNADLTQALITEKGKVVDKKEDLVLAMDGIADKVTLLVAAREDLVTAKQTVLTAKESLYTQKVATVAQLQILIDAMSGLNDVRMELVAAKTALLPYVEEKAQALQSHATEIAAWIVVQREIAELKEDIAALKEIEADSKILKMTEQIRLEGFELALKEAKINLEIAKLTGRSTITDTKIDNLYTMLAAEKDKIERDLDVDNLVLSKRISVDEYVEMRVLETITAIVGKPGPEHLNDGISVPSQRRRIEGVSEERIRLREETAEISASAELTSSLVHLLSSG